MSDEINAKIGKAVRTARLAKGLSQAQVGDRIGLSRASVANLEAGRQGLPFPTMAAVVQVLGIDLAPLIALVEVPDLPPVPHDVVIRPVSEVCCLTCDGKVLRVTGDKDLAKKAKAAHVAEMQEADRD